MEINLGIGEVRPARTMGIHLEAVNNLTFLEEIRQRAEKHGHNLSAQLFMEIICKFPIKITMPCGQTYEIATLDNFPEKTLMCPCGDPNHILVDVQIPNMEER